MDGKSAKPREQPSLCPGGGPERHSGWALELQPGSQQMTPILSMLLRPLAHHCLPRHPTRKHLARRAGGKLPFTPTSQETRLECFAQNDSLRILQRVPTPTSRGQWRACFLLGGIWYWEVGGAPALAGVCQTWLSLPPPAPAVSTACSGVLRFLSFLH